MDTCDLCDADVIEYFSLCEECGEKVKSWDENTDTYHLHDGRKLSFSTNYNQYEKI